MQRPTKHFYMWNLSREDFDAIGDWLGRSQPLSSEFTECLEHFDAFDPHRSYYDLTCSTGGGSATLRINDLDPRREIAFKLRFAGQYE